MPNQLREQFCYKYNTNSLHNKNAFQWDAYRPLVDRIPPCTVRGVEGGLPLVLWGVCLPLVLGRGVYAQGGIWPGGCLSLVLGGVCPRGVSASGPRGCLFRGVSRGWCLGGVCPRGVSASGPRGVCPRGVSAWGGVCPGCVCLWSWGVSAQGVSASGPGGCLSRGCLPLVLGTGVSQHAMGQTPPSMDRQIPVKT